MYLWFLFLLFIYQLETLNPSMFNNTKYAQRDFLLFNRVPKVGSEQLIELIRRLSVKNGFTVGRAPFSAPIRSRLNEDEQEDFANEINEMEESHVYTVHVNYINFRDFDLPQPIYINMVRDPIERIISWFYYRRTPWNAVQMYNVNGKFRHPQFYKKNFQECVTTHDVECRYITGTGFKNQPIDHKRQTLFFCGHDDICEPFNTDAALQLAMQHVERDYAVVGSWEDLNVTLTVLENYIPKYFNNVTKLYFDAKEGMASTVQNVNPWKPKICEETKAILRKNFTKEYEFYRFCKQRLYKQYLALNIVQ